MSRIYTHAGGLFFDYKRKSTLFTNEMLNDEMWKINEYWFVSVRFNPKWFEDEYSYYDGHYVRVITILGIAVGKGYSWDSRPLSSW